MENEFGEINICDEIWDNLNGVCEISYVAHIASGLRFRYLSEIEKKSYSLLKSEKNTAPILKIITNDNSAYLQIEPVTENGNSAHFNMLYEVFKDKTPIFYDQPYTIHFNSIGTQHIKLDNLGIRKMKQKEAMLRIKELYPQWTESAAKQFFNKEKDVIRLKATLFQYEINAAEITSDPIRSQNMKENKEICISHIAPKDIAGNDEQIIIVLKKKITTNNVEAFVIVSEKEFGPLKLIHKDQQTFVFDAPKVRCETTTQSEFVMRCGDNEDRKPIRFHPLVIEPRKRKTNENTISDVPVKRSIISNENINFGFVNQLLPESGSGMHNEIQTDNIHYMEVENKAPNFFVQESNRLEFDNVSHTDSGIHSEERLLERSSTEDDMSSSEDSGTDCIEIEGAKSKDMGHNQSIVIDVPPKTRPSDSHLNVNSSNHVNKTILREVARIGHDFAFGRKEVELFDRVEKHLPVVFTLQDDVGDTPLNNAILQGNAEHASKILSIVSQNCQWALDLVNTSGHSALILAPACEVPPQLIDKLLVAGCRIDLWDDTGKSAIIYAIEYKNVDALKVLLKHVSVQGNKLKNVVSRYKTSYYTPLQIAIREGFDEGVRMLLELKNLKGEFMVDVDEVALLGEETALHIAIKHSQINVDIVKLLLSRPDIDVNKLSNKESALHIANQSELFEISSLLKLYNAFDIPSCFEEDNIEDSDEETNEGTQDAAMCCENENKSVDALEIEMLPESQKPEKVETLTSSMRSMSLKGEQKKKIIDLLLKPPGATLNVENLKEIVKPSFRQMFNKYDHTNELSDISELFDRFNCLPNSIEQLFENLDKIGRFDMKTKILNVFSQLHF